MTLTCVESGHSCLACQSGYIQEEERGNLRGKGGIEVDLTT